MFKKKIKKNITTNAEVLNINEIVKEVNLIYLNIGDREFLDLIAEYKKQSEYFEETGNNFFMVIIKAGFIEIYKNGTHFKNISNNAVKFNSDNTIDVKYIPTLKDNDYVEFYLDE